MARSHHPSLPCPALSRPVRRADAAPPSTCRMARETAWLDCCFAAAESRLAALLPADSTSGAGGSVRAGPLPLHNLPCVDAEAMLGLAAHAQQHAGGTGRPIHKNESSRECPDMSPFQKVSSSASQLVGCCIETLAGGRHAH